MPIDDSPIGQPPSSRLMRYGALIVGSGLFFALTSPFNAVTYLPFFVRWAYWVGLISLTTMTHWITFRLTDERLPRWAAVLLVSIVSTPVVFSAIVLVQQAIERPVATAFWWSVIASVWVINVVLAMLAAHFDQVPRPSIDQATETDSNAAAGIRNRLPVDVRDDEIWALGAQDHYLDVILPTSHHLIHMRFGDAMSMLAGDAGLQVHRSWWVAREAIDSIVKQGRKVEIRLHTGQTIPVSRAGAARLRDAGWM